MQISSISPLNIQLFYKSLTDRGLSPRTVRYVHALVCSSLKHAVNLRVLSHSPAVFVDLPRMPRTEMKAFSREEAARFLTAAKDDRYGIVFALALTTGMRPEEYLALHWKDLDLIQGTATVQRTLVWRKGGGSYFGEPKSAHSRRTVPFPTSVLKWLLEHRRQQMEERLKLGADYENHDLVFATAEGKPLHYRNVANRHFRPVLIRAKLPATFRLYDLRHSCATLLLGENEHPKVVSERLGHASVTLTLDTYSHVLPTMQRAATEKLESLLFG
jgi:integrase